MNKALKLIVFFLIVTIIYHDVAQAQTVEPFTFSFETLQDPINQNSIKSCECKQNNEKEGLKIQISELYNLYYIAFELNLNYATNVGNTCSFPLGNHSVMMGLTFDDGFKASQTVSAEKIGQLIKTEMNFNNFVDNNKNKIDISTILSIITKQNVTEIFICKQGDYGNLQMWMWRLNSFKTAPTINVMLQRIIQEHNKQKESTKKYYNTENALSKGNWRSNMNSVMDNVFGLYFGNMLYRGQEIDVGYYITASHGLGVNKWQNGTFYWGNWSNGAQHGVGIYICPQGKFISHCSNSVYYVGNWNNDVKSGNGTCYDEYGNLIYYGKFSNGYPTEAYPSIGNYSSYKFECIEYDCGDKYVGETKDGERHGQGIYLWKNGDAWYGNWNNGMRNGYGLHLYYNGMYLYGRWLNDIYY